MSLPRGPRQLIHRGVVEASAILVDGALAGPLDARRRVVAAWAPGVAVHRLGAALLVRFPAPRRVDCARAPGLPLVRVSDAPGAPLASAPLAPDELAAAAPPRDAVLVVRAGAITAAVPEERDREDPAAYLDLEGFAVVRPEPLGPAPAVLTAAPTTSTARELLGVAAAPSEQRAVLAALEASRAGAARAGAGPATGRAGLSFFAGLLAALSALLARLVPPGAPRGAATGGTSRALAAVPQQPSGPSLAERVSARLRAWLAQALIRARLAQYLGRRQAEYLDRLFDMLDRGDLGEALRHAIPLGGGGDTSVGPALGVPSPRSGLDISLGPRRAATSALFMGGDFYDHLRRKYRVAFERLEREGRIDEAAFVLAELLHEEAEAVAFLERHGRLRLAAELAEARDLAPGLVVRQWFLARDVARALRIARRHGAFSDALVRLGTHPSAPELRALWADALAEAGDFAAAVDVIWPMEHARKLGVAWIEAALDQGGTAAARMLARKLELLPASFAEVRERALALLGDAGAADERRAFAEALARGTSNPGARTLARPALRALVGDGARSGEAATRALVEKLTAFAGDAVLRADLPGWPTAERTALARLAPPRRLELDASDTGATPILDAATLPGGRIVIALGEAGVRVIGRHGRPLFHLDQPAHRLVVSDRGDRALALAPRGDAVRVARLDLVGRRGEVWCEAPRLEAFAADFDGSQWVVATSGKLLVIDALEQRFEALMSFDLSGDELPVAEAIGRSPGACAVMTGTILRRFDLPTWTLRQQRHRGRRDPDEYPDYTAGASAGSGAFLGRRVEEGVPQRAELIHVREIGNGRATFSPEEVPLAMAMRSGWIAIAARVEERIEVRLLDDRELATRAQITLGGAGRASLRFGDEALTVADDRGRVVVVELAHGGLVQELRV